MQEKLNYSQIAVALSHPEDPEKFMRALGEAIGFFSAMVNFEKELRNLHAVATSSLVNGGQSMEEGLRGHRLGTIEMCEAVLKLF